MSYNAKIGTFLERDPAEATNNLYEPVGSNPAGSVDPTGLQAATTRPATTTSSTSSPSTTLPTSLPTASAPAHKYDYLSSFILAYELNTVLVESGALTGSDYLRGTRQQQGRLEAMARECNKLPASARAATSQPEARALPANWRFHVTSVGKDQNPENASRAESEKTHAVSALVGFYEKGAAKKDYLVKKGVTLNLVVDGAWRQYTGYWTWDCTCGKVDEMGHTKDPIINKAPLKTKEVTNYTLAHLPADAGQMAKAMAALNDAIAKQKALVKQQYPNKVLDYDILDPRSIFMPEDEVIKKQGAIMIYLEHLHKRFDELWVDERK